MSPDTLWFHSITCGDGACVEVAMEEAGVNVRNSEFPGERLFFTPEEWRAFIEGVKAGQFDVD